MARAICNYKKISFGLALITLLLSPLSYADSQAKIAIVIDDLGYRRSDAAAIALAGDFTYAIVPFAPLTQKLAQAAHARNKEVIAHIPMEATHGNESLGAGAITAQMNKQQLIQQLKLSINNVPHAKGINNHMGSHLTTLSQPIHWVMEQLAQNDLYFLDSKTTSQSLGESVALKYGLQTGHRHVFLDNKLDHASLARQFNQLIRIAKRHQNAIAIAHPHPQTVAFLTSIQQQLDRHNIKLVPLSEILPYTTKLALAKSSSQPVAAPHQTVTLPN